MAYEPTEWKKGDVITAEKMNKIENGIVGNAGSNPRILVLEYEELAQPRSYTLGKLVNITVQEIIDAYTNGYFIVFPLMYEYILHYYLPYDFSYNENTMSMYLRPTYNSPFLELILSYDPNYYEDNNVYVTFPD